VTTLTSGFESERWFTTEYLWVDAPSVNSSLLYTKHTEPPKRNSELQDISFPCRVTSRLHAAVFMLHRTDLLTTS
jgi:hypothetical protein